MEKNKKNISSDPKNNQQGFAQLIKMQSFSLRNEQLVHF